MRFEPSIRRRRQALGLTLEELADRCGLTANYIGSLELGRRDPSLSTIQALAKGLKTSAGELLGVRDLGPEGLEGGRLLEQVPVDVRRDLLVLLRTLAGKPR